MRIHKGNLVVRHSGFDQLLEPWFAKPGLVVCNPYEDAVHLTDQPVIVTTLVLVCDIMIDGALYPKIPLEHLEKIHRQLP